MNALPSSMNAVVFTGEQQAAFVSCPVDDTPLAEHEITGRTVASLVSAGTELNSGFLQTGTGRPRQTGYAAVFEVEAVGAGVTDFAPGDHVFCMGHHASRQRVPQTESIRLPEGMAPAVGVFTRLMGVGWCTLTTTAARPPDLVLVTGLGPVGNLTAQIFQSAGYRVIAVDPVESRRSVAQRAGLPVIRSSVPLDDESLAGEIGLAIDCSGHEQAVLDACHMIRRRCEVVLIATPWHRRCDMQAFDLLHAVFHKYVILRSGWEWQLPGHPQDFTTGSIWGNLRGAAQWLHEGRVRVEPLYRCVSPAACQEAYQNLLHQQGEYVTVVFDWEAVD